MGSIERGLDRPGEDLRSGVPSDDPPACLRACQGESRCWAWTWVKPKGKEKGACWLKGNSPAAVRNDCCFSGIRVVATSDNYGKGLRAPSERPETLSRQSAVRVAPKTRPEETHSNTGNKKGKPTTSQATQAVQRLPVIPTQIKPQFKGKMIIKPKIESWFAIPGGPLKPGTRLFLKGQVFGTQPGKILMYGKFPNSPVEFHNVQWVGDKKVNGVVPVFMNGQVNQKVSIRVQRSGGVLSEAREMNFVGRLEYTCEATIIYGSDGSEKNCTPYACYSDNIGVHCHEKCESTNDCDLANYFHCNSASKCVDKH